MEMILDTNAVSAWLDGEPDIESKMAQASRLLLSSIVLGEFRFGIQYSRHRKEYESRLTIIEREIPTIDIDAMTARHYAFIRKTLKEAGMPIPWHDLWIAAQASQHSLSVLSRDGHFDRVAGIRRVGW